MDMIQTLNAQLALMTFFALIPMFAMMQARRPQRSKMKFFMPEDDDRARRSDATRPGGRV